MSGRFLFLIIWLCWETARQHEHNLLKWKGCFQVRIENNDTRMSDKDIFERVVFEFSAQQILTKDADKWGMFVRSLPEEWTTSTNERARLRHQWPIRGWGSQEQAAVALTAYSNDVGRLMQETEQLSRLVNTRPRVSGPSSSPRWSIWLYNSHRNFLPPIWIMIGSKLTFCGSIV